MNLRLPAFLDTVIVLMLCPINHSPGLEDLYTGAVGLLYQNIQADWDRSLLIQSSFLCQKSPVTAGTALVKSI